MNVWVDNIQLSAETTPGNLRIVTQPVSQTVLVNHAATFSVTVNDPVRATYQWFRGGTAISGATDSSYTLASAALGDPGVDFTVQATKGNTVTSAPATLTVVNLVPPSAPTVAFDLNEAAWAGEDLRAALARGGSFAPMPTASVALAGDAASLEVVAPKLTGEGSHVLLAFPHGFLYAGRGANLPWLQEIADTVAKVSWSSWAEVSIRTASGAGWSGATASSLSAGLRSRFWAIPEGHRCPSACARSCSTGSISRCAAGPSCCCLRQAGPSSWTR